jgi:hypothetical protein
MPSKAMRALVGASAHAGALAIPLATRVNATSEIARRNWINTLNHDLKAGINYEAVRNTRSPLLFSA